MTKKISALISLTLILTLMFMIVLSVGTVSADIHNTENQAADYENETAVNSNQLPVSDDFKNNIEENIQYEPNSGNKQYTVAEAPGLITEEKAKQRVIDPNKAMVAITYDDGPSQYTSRILDILKENNSVATFFILGQRVYNNEGILSRTIDEGSQIGNHSYNHKNLTTISDEELYRQVQGTDDLVRIATGYTPTVMRPPYGSTTEVLNKKIQRPVIKWSIDTRDWENRNVEMIKNSILDNVKDGDIILMHDLYDSTAEASKIVIPELLNRGYQLVTIDELFEYRDGSLIAGEQYYNMYK